MSQGQGQVRMCHNDGVGDRDDQEECSTRDDPRGMCYERGSERKGSREMIQEA